MLKLERFEKNLDEKLEKVLGSKLFLQAVGAALNANSYRKAVTHQLLVSGWKMLQLPNKRDQERTLHLINELHHRIAELEAKLESAKDSSEPALAAPEMTRKKTRSGSELVSVQ